jgi:hypothetical protein
VELAGHRYFLFTLVQATKWPIARSMSATCDLSCLLSPLQSKTMLATPAA